MFDKMDGTTTSDGTAAAAGQMDAETQEIWGCLCSSFRVFGPCPGPQVLDVPVIQYM